MNGSIPGPADLKKGPEEVLYIAVTYHRSKTDKRIVMG